MRTSATGFSFVTADLGQHAAGLLVAQRKTTAAIDVARLWMAFGFVVRLAERFCASASYRGGRVVVIDLQ
ncbi:hypothetical protein CO659_12935 [Rhizobium sp. S9]|nr:hypothetical protein CO659_12935 [Rhizobium sp. S9]